MRFSDFPLDKSHELTVNIARDLHRGVAISKIAKKYGLSPKQVRCIRFKLARGDFDVDWSDFNFDFSVKYGDIDEDAVKSHAKSYRKSDIDWANINIGPCLGIWGDSDDD